MHGALLYTMAADAAVMLVLALAYMAAPRRLSASSFYRLCAVIQCFATGLVASQQSWWAIVPGVLAGAFAALAWTVNGRADRAQHLAHLIHADRENP